MEEAARASSERGGQRDLAAELRAVEWEVLDLIQRLDALREQLRSLQERVTREQSGKGPP
jgi:hypothetical protein